MSDDFWFRNGLMSEMMNVVSQKNSGVSRVGNIWNFVKSLFM